MKINALLMHDMDNVVTCTETVAAGGTVCYKKNGEYLELKALEEIPNCHKVAVAPIGKDEHVIKYGEIIGAANEEIERGRWVSHLNIRSIPRDYESEYI